MRLVFLLSVCMITLIGLMKNNILSLCVCAWVCCVWYSFLDWEFKIVDKGNNSGVTVGGFNTGTHFEHYLSDSEKIIYPFKTSLLLNIKC